MSFPKLECNVYERYSMSRSAGTAACVQVWCERANLEMSAKPIILSRSRFWCMSSLQLDLLRGGSQSGATPRLPNRSTPMQGIGAYKREMYATGPNAGTSLNHESKL
jgi:hypothetical protein